MSDSLHFAALAGFAFKSTIVLVAARLMAFLLGGRSAAARHLVWTAASAAVLALPFLSFSLPAWRVSGPAANETADTGLVFQALTVAVEETSPAAAPANIAGPMKSAPWRPDWPAWLMWAWVVGTAAAFAQMLAAYGALWRIRRAARPFGHRGIADALAQALGIGQPVPVWETAAGSMPMTFGFLRASILMPSDWERWSEERRRMVLLHELAHVRRGDTVTHLMARTALSLNWWNPLAWMAWREFLKERERATDDLVLSAGARASEYAGHLLDLARSMQTAAIAAGAAVAMARPSQLEERLIAILDARANRKAAGRMAPALAAIAAIVLVAPFAAVRAQEKPVPPELDATIVAANSQKNHEILERAAAAYEQLMKYDVAETLLEKALVIRGQVSGEQSAAYAAGLVKLGDLAVKRGQIAEADAFYGKAVSLGDRPEVAPALVYLGTRAFGKRDLVGAKDLFQRAINVDPRGPQAGPAMTWMATLENTGTVVFRTATIMVGDHYAAPDQIANLSLSEDLYQRALATEDPNSLAAANTMELYARFLRQQKRTDEAAAIEARAGEIRKTRIAAAQRYSGNSVSHVGHGVSAPVVIFKKDPVYSPEARAAKVEGTVLLSIEIGPDGAAHNFKVLQSLGLDLDENAIDAVKQWRFKPGSQDGQPVTVAANIELNFRIM
ncbi:TonB family protein [Candidatus Sulfopaludibacter sp. SbA4]|nr:TonB family protein [Candidatus Sulfopaludibacter sp. SbA4]